MKENKSSFKNQFFLKEIDKTGLVFNKLLITRFICSLLTKPFVILTGLSGSGKTKMAQVFINWIINPYEHEESKKTFELNEIIKSNRVSYQITSLDSLSITLTQIETGTKVTLPYELIYEWIDVIKGNNFDLSTTPRTIRETVELQTKYSTQLNSFETHLKATAFHLIYKKQILTKKNYSQFCFVPVGADWTNREPLLGYPNALEGGKYVLPESEVLNLILEAGKAENQNKPYFLILDEMNLSHVERYFADFLSAMESGESIPLHSTANWLDDVPAQIKLPKNLFIVGTVNIDETTYMFSPKVLDRANVIEFRVSKDEMVQYLKNIKPLNLEDINGQGKDMAESFVELANDKSLKPIDSDKLNKTLLDFFKELKKTGAEFGYRSASEIHRFVAVANQLDPTWQMDEIIDCAIMQKLLPKVHGSRRKLEPVLKTLGALCLADGQKVEEIFNRKTEIDFNDKSISKYPVSLEKIDRMYHRLIENGFTSYAEA